VTNRIALRVLQAGGFSVVLASVPYKLFDLDRFFVPKELALNLSMTIAAALCVATARRVSISHVDRLLAAWLGLGILSAVFAQNLWLAERSVALSLGGAACFWCARSLSRAGFSRALVAALALAGVIGALTALLQAYGVRTELFSLNRAPGGTFGNRNFMAHLCVITLPALLYSGVRAPSKAALLRWCGGAAVVAGALILSRTRAAWLALLVGLVILIATGMIAVRRNDGSLKFSRLFVLLLAAALGGGAALVIPNTLDWKSDSPYLETANSLVNYKGGSGHGRLIQYGNSLRMSLRHPLLGVGPGNWPVVYPKFASAEDPSLGQDGTTSNPWPSSDWVTFISERGIAAVAALGLAIVILLADGLRALTSGASTEEKAAASVLLSTLVILVIVGTFDAVLLLPVGAFIGWALVGALAAPTRERMVFDVGPMRRALFTLVVVAAGLAASARNAGQLTAMSLYNSASRVAVIERSSSFDPGSYRIHLRLAQLYANRGDCGRSRPHAAMARKLFPSAPAARRAAAACGA
jgi:O-antigen ligase